MLLITYFTTDRVLLFTFVLLDSMHWITVFCECNWFGVYFHSNVPPPIFESQLGSVISQLFSAISFVTIPLVKLTHIFNIVLRDFFIWPSPPSIDGNNFGGTLPKEMVSLEVNRFHIINNITIGSIPGAFSVIVSLLQHVNIYFHKLTGTIPIF